MNTSPKTILLIDGNSLVHRAFHALPPLTNRQGELLNAVFGYGRILLNLLHEEAPTHAVVAFDLPEPTFRHKLFDDYKAHRPETDPQLVGQLGRVKQLTRALGLPIVELAGFEADDVIGTLAHDVVQAQPNWQVTIVTGDKDLMQLVSERVTLIYSRGKANGEERYDPAGVSKRFGFGPDYVVDYKSLCGDTSDNIPGVKGVGDKTATKLIEQYGHLDQIYAALEADPDAFTTRVRNQLASEREMAQLSRTLATIKCDVPIDFALEDAKLGEADLEEVTELLKELEFHSLLKLLPGRGGAEPEAQLNLFAGTVVPETTRPVRLEASDYTTQAVESLVQLADLVKQITAHGEVAFDTETSSLDPHTATLAGISLCWTDDQAWYVPVGHQAGANLPLEQALSALRPVFEDPKLRKIAHNFKFDALVLKVAGIELQGYHFDTMLAAYLIHPGLRSYGLKELAMTECGLPMRPITELIGKGKEQIGFDQVPVAEATPYAALDALATLRLKHILAARLREAAEAQADAGETTVASLFDQIEMPLVAVLTEMEWNGVKLDTAFLKEMSGILANEIGSLETALYDIAEHPFNLNSPQQLGEVLFDQLNLPKPAKTKTGQYKTDAATLESLAGSHPAVDAILRYRELAKLKSTYVDALPPLVNPVTGRVHTSYNQAVTSTGRLSSSDPNLQNIPIRTELGQKIRQAFIAEPGHRLVAADYSQMEFRVLAHMARDERMMEAFRRGADFHTETAAGIFGTYPEQVSKDQRRVAKTVNFGVIYGQSKYGLSKQLGISQEEAEHFINEFYATYPPTAALMAKLKLEARTKGYVETLLGRVRYIPEIKARNRMQQQSGERMAMNMPIQGTAADIMKLAMLAVDQRLRESDLQAKVIMQVHDELVLEAPEAEVAAVSQLLRQAMENAYPLDVPLKVDVEVGENWGEMEDIG